MKDLIDPEDGENRAVRAFLMLYGGACGVTVGQMRVHMRRIGFPSHWPQWAEDSPDGVHLTKGGAQNWLRHLFALEAAPTPESADAARPWDRIEDVFEVLSAARKGEWGWFANSECKYIEVRIDMRDGGCILRNREGKRITLDEFRRQQFDGKGIPWHQARAWMEDSDAARTQAGEKEGAA